MKQIGGASPKRGVAALMEDGIATATSLPNDQLMLS